MLNALVVERKEYYKRGMKMEIEITEEMKKEMEAEEDAKKYYSTLCQVDGCLDLHATDVGIKIDDIEATINVCKSHQKKIIKIMKRRKKNVL